MKVKLEKYKKLIVFMLIIISCMIYFLFIKIKYDYVFYIPEVDIYVYTKKKLGGDFLIMFSNQRTKIRHVSTVDYIETDTGAYINIYFDVLDKNVIAVVSAGKELTSNEINFEFKTKKINDINYDSFSNFYFEGRKGLGKRYIWLAINTLEYDIALDGRELHDGGFWGN